MDGKTPYSSSTPRPPFWAASIAVHAAAAAALVVWGAGMAAEPEVVIPAEITADVDYTSAASPAEDERTEEPEIDWRPSESPFGEPARPAEDWDLEEEKPPSDYVLPRVPVPPLEWSREAIVRPLPRREELETPRESPPAAVPPPRSEERDPGPARTPSGVTTSARPDANRSPAPRYPRSARRRGLEGRVVLVVAIDASGRPTAVTVSKSSGHGVLDRAAIEALWKWRFIPARRNGVAVPSRRHQAFRFVVE